MKHFFKIFLLLFLSNCSKIEQQKNDNNSELVKVEFLEVKKSDTIQEPNYIAIFDKESELKSNITKSELKIVNKHILNSVNDYNKKLKITLEKWNKEAKTTKWNYEKEKINLRYYFRQYIISKNENGDKIVRILCFCSSMGDWKNEIIQVYDGGDCYLNAIINLTQNKTEYFGTNGLA